MSNNKFKTYCRILDYVEAVDPELARLVKGTCADLVLNSIRGKPGITFLMPQDKSVRAKLEKLAYSDNVEEATQACDMMNAHIIRDVFRTPAEWKTREVPNSLLPSQVVEIASANGTEVVFKSGAKAVLDTNFKDSSKRKNLAVWKLVSGEIPVTTNKPAKPSNFIKNKTGSYEVSQYESQNMRFKIAIALENAYILERLQRQSGDIYQKYTLSLVNKLINSGRDDILYNLVLPLISYDKIDFYLLVEPHSTKDFLIDDSIISEWWSDPHKFTFDVAATRQKIEEMLRAPTIEATGAMKSGVYTSRPKLLESITAIRASCNEYVNSNKARFIVQKLKEQYAILESENKLGAVGEVLPPGLLAYYKARPGLKMMHDELRYVTCHAFMDLEGGGFDYTKFHEIVNIIGECLYAGNENRASASKLLNENNMKYLISPQDNVNEIKMFIMSTMFMYIPLTCEEADKLPNKNSVNRNYAETANIVYNMAKQIHTHARAYAGEHSNTNIVALLKGLNVDTLDQALRDELKAKFGV